MQTNPTLGLRPTQPDDLAEVMALERHPDNVGTIMPWSRQEHLAAMGQPTSRHMVVTVGHDPRPAGLVILRGVEPGRVVELKRIVIRAKDQGHGRAVLGLVEELAFGGEGAAGLRLDVMEHNARGQYLYQSVGYQFTDEPPIEFVKDGRPARFLRMLKRATA